MKRIITVFISLLLIMSLLCACDNSRILSPDDTSAPQTSGYDTAADNIAGDFIYRRANTDDGKNLLLKYNVHTGEVDTVCNDPFCTHSDDGCPFWSPIGAFVANTVYIGNTVYFIKVSSSDGKYNIGAYSPADISMSYIYTTNNSLSSLFAYGQYLFFSETFDMSARKHAVIRLDAKTGDIMYLHENTSDNIYAIIGGRIIWDTSKGSESTDLNGKDVKAVSKNDRSGYTYKTELISGSSFRDLKLEMHRRKTSADDWELVASGIGPATFVGNKIIYFKPLPLDEQNVLYSDGSGTYYDYYGGCVYVMNTDGSDNHLLCRVSDVNIVGMSSDRTNELVCGNYVGIYISHEPYAPDRASTDTDLLIVNIETGEYVVARYENK